MSLSIYANCTENAVASDERMMTNAMTNAASALLESHNEREEDIAGAVIDETVYRNHHVEQFQTPPCQVLIDAQAYFDVNLAEYFGFTRNGHARRRTPQGRLLLHPDDEVDFGYIGIEAKPIVGKSGKLEGTMIGLGRFLCSLQVDASQDEHIACTEIVTWRKMNGQSQYGDVRICRVPWDIYCADTCSKNNLMYVVFYRAQGPLPRAPGDDATDESDSLGRKTVIAFPLMPATDTAAPTCPRYFPDEQFRFTCSDFVSYVTVDCNGTLIVGTNNGFVEIWKPDTVKGPTRVALINMKEATATSVKRLEHAQKEQLVPNQDHDAIMSHKSSSLAPTPSLQTDTDLPLVIGDSVPIMVEGEDVDIESVATRLANANDDRNELDNELDVAMEDQAPVVVANDNEIENLPRVLGTSEVDSLHFPNHLGVEECGFITQQNSRAEGTTLLLWKKVGGDLDNEFQVVSQINLPLSPLRKPRVHYDGRRIVVCGQDHIGVIILVYHVFSSTEDVEYFPLNFDTKLGDESGGLYNFTMNPHVRFANRIRHAALGGLERFEAMFMTCNERFIMVNTKTGNLLGGGASPSGEGLLVIDLYKISLASFPNEQALFCQTILLYVRKPRGVEATYRT
jgi:hypothetical protein